MQTEAIWLQSYWRVNAVAVALGLMVALFSPYARDIDYALAYALGSALFALLSQRIRRVAYLHPFFIVALSYLYAKDPETLASGAPYWVFVFLAFLAIYAAASLSGLVSGLPVLISAFIAVMGLAHGTGDLLGALFFWGVALGMGLEYQRVKNELLAHQERLAAAAFTDALTGVANRHALEADYPRLRALAERTGQKLWLTFWDVDGLKAVNDKKGHAAGDRFLRHFADALRRSVRASDGLYRFGGDEFVGLHLGLEHPEQLEERVKKHVRKFSMGYVEASGLSLEEALRAADEHLYARKQQKSLSERQAFLTQELYLLDGPSEAS